jgi:very-short-patch-repair endonuclease
MKNDKSNINYQNYYAKERILHDGELAFYRTLKEIIEPTNIIFCKVRLEDIVGARDNEWQEINRNRIKSKHIDFVVYDQEQLRIKIAIELDGRTHLKADQREKDRFKDKLFFNCQIPLIRIPYAHYYDPIKLKEDLNREWELVNKRESRNYNINTFNKIIGVVKTLLGTSRQGAANIPQNQEKPLPINKNQTL